jgi:hypothetical protein
MGVSGVLMGLSGVLMSLCGVFQTCFVIALLVVLRCGAMRFCRFVVVFGGFPVCFMCHGVISFLGAETHQLDAGLAGTKLLTKWKPFAEAKVEIVRRFYQRQIPTVCGHCLRRSLKSSG